MKTTKQARRDAKELFRAAQTNGLLDEARARQIVEQVLAARPRGYLAVLGQFTRLIKLDIARRTASIESVIPLDDAQRNQVRAALSGRYGAGLAFSFSQNPDLIGGMRIRVGSDVYDGSIQSRLAQLQEA